MEGTQSVSIDADSRTQILTKRMLVFLEPPAAGDLRDTYTLGVDESFSSVIYTSPDAVELWREETAPGALTLTWLPREPIRLYAAYEHQNGWMPSAIFKGAAVCTEYQCDMRTGMFTIDLLASSPFEAAVVFRRPRWQRRLSERRIVRAALHALRTPGGRPRMTDEGRHIEAPLPSPRVGERYVFVAFRQGGVAACETFLKEISIVGRAQRLLGRWAPAFGD